MTFTALSKFKQMLSGIDMTQGKPWKSLLLFTVPLLIGNLFQQMYSTADAIILGRFVGDNALAAVGSSIPMFFLLMVIMMGISMGAGVMVAQYFGAKRREDLSHTIGAALTLTTILGVVMMVIGPFVTRPLLLLLDTPAEIIDDSVLYMTVLMVGILGMAYFNILSGILRGLGDAFSPLLYLAVTSILNIFLNLLLIPEAGAWTLFGVAMPGFGFGVWGAAVGTVFAQGLTSLLCLRRLGQMRDVFDLSLKYLRPKKEYANQLLKLGIPTAASQAIFAIAMMIVQPLANSFGPMFLAVNIIVMRIDSFVMMPNFSFGNAMTVYAGQNMGAGRLDRLSSGVKQSICMTIGTAVVLVAAVLIFGHHIAGLFTETEEVIVMALRMLRILAIGYVIFGVNMVLWGAIRGAGDAVTPMWAAIINTIVVRVPTAYLFVHFFGRPEALFFSLLAGWTTNCMLGILAYRFGKWRTKGLVKRE
ncbi:MAG: MATE family efflux transporter [Firmicutes bacterium]|nr:MATE family efflux transporter [Bacillota bacterium]